MIVSGIARHLRHPFPRIANIEEMTAYYYDYKADGDPKKKFVVPRSHWDSILSSLRPSTGDQHPTKWPVLGELHIATKDGSRVDVLLAFIPDQSMGFAGAFAVEKGPAERDYYRGGNSYALLEALKAAYEESRKRSE
jgi:hypothetical protein